MSKVIQHYVQQWENNAQKDPLWSILSSGGIWSVDDFFATGEEEISRVFNYMRQSGMLVKPETFLDFGCGVGRISRPLKARFAKGHGVDISSQMIELARQYVPNVNFLVNQADYLELHGGNTFDFVYCHQVLQHMSNDLQKRYIRDFFRVLKPGGLAVFQIPNEKLGGNRDGVFIKTRDMLKKIIPGFKQIYEPYRRSRKEKKQREKMQGMERFSKIAIEMHCLPDESVRDLCKENACDVERVVVTNSLEDGYLGQIKFYDPKKKITLLRRGRVRKFLSQMYFIRKVSAP
jgi:ubiquinone/menaquinone biosynthesis C-methylase UbiE